MLAKHSPGHMSGLAVGFWLTVFVALSCLAVPVRGTADVYVADPTVTSGPNYYLSLLSRLAPGDTLELPSGTYRERLNLSGLQGTASQWITITGPTSCLLYTSDAADE